MTEFRLKIKLVKEDLGATITVKKDVAEKDFETLVKVINKAKKSDIDLSPLINFLKSDDLNALTDLGWRINDAEFTISADDLLVYYEEQDIEGGSHHHAHEIKWPHISIAELGTAQFQLMMNEKITTAPYFRAGGYVLKKLRDKHVSVIGERRRNKDVSIEPKKVEKSEPKVKKITLTKKEQSECRSNIIDKATLSDMNVGGFTNEFISALSEKERSYLSDLSNLQTKLMMNAVTKK